MNFRNYAQADIVPSAGVTVLHGANAQGKTNLIEAVHLCCLGRSHRTARDMELIRFSELSAQVAVEVGRRDGVQDVSVSLYRQEKRKKIIRVNHTPVQRIGELMGHVNAVLFSPEDLRLVKDGPDMRRRFLDMEISQLYPAYFFSLQQYLRTLAQRNELLRKMEGGKRTSLLDTLDAWDALLADHGARVAWRRRVYLERLGEAASQTHGQISGGEEALRLSYLSRVEDRETYAALLRAARQEDIRRGTTGVGPHRDDFRIEINGREARVYGSQGQQRTAALSIKLAEISVMRDETGESPVLLLDDVMSELDMARRKMLLSHMENTQTLVTCTHLSDLGDTRVDAAFRVREGTVEAE